MQKVRRSTPLPIYFIKGVRRDRLIVYAHRISGISVALPFLGFFSPFPHGTCTLSVIEEYLGLEGGPPFSRRRFKHLNKYKGLTGKNRTLSPANERTRNSSFSRLMYVLIVRRGHKRYINATAFKVSRGEAWGGTNLQGYHLLWPDLPTFSQFPPS